MSELKILVSNAIEEAGSVVGCGYTMGFVLIEAGRSAKRIFSLRFSAYLLPFWRMQMSFSWQVDRWIAAGRVEVGSPGTKCQA